jgi:hypothetical protein
MSREFARLLGHKLYRGGKCVRGHEGFRRVSDGQCRTCERLRKDGTLKPLIAPTHGGRLRIINNKLEDLKLLRLSKPYLLGEL